MKKPQTKSTRISELNKNENTNINICELHTNHYLEARTAVVSGPSNCWGD